MSKSFIGALLLGAVLCGSVAAQQPSTRLPQGRLEVALVSDTLLSNAAAGSRLAMQGGSIQIHGQFWRGWGVVADVAGEHRTGVPSGAVGLDLVTATFGPRYTWALAKKRYELFGQMLVGEANGINSLFPGHGGASENAFAMALKVGAGLDVRLSPHVGLRALEADWLRTQLPNATTNVQNNLRLGAGAVYRF